MTLAAFLSILAIHLMAAISPGPSFVMAVRVAVADGFRAASFLAVGFGLGAIAWALAALLGLHLLFEIAPMTLWAFKIAGAAFLLWIAWQTWRHAADPLPEIAADAVPRDARSAFRLGLLTQLANPKPAIFFGAVFVGMVPPGSSVGILSLLLAIIFLNETLWYMLVGRLFSLPAARRGYGRLKRHVDHVFGALIAAFGLKIAIT